VNLYFILLLNKWFVSYSFILCLIRISEQKLVNNRNQTSHLNSIWYMPTKSSDTPHCWFSKHNGTTSWTHFRHFVLSLMHGFMGHSKKNVLNKLIKCNNHTFLHLRPWKVHLLFQWKLRLFVSSHFDLTEGDWNLVMK